jgi:4-amino-4-deoxy-L-arabinose transferase-like glycosyltransferase
MVPSRFSSSIFISLFILVAYSLTLAGAILPLTGDQKTYLSIALEMMTRKSWVIPLLFDEPNFLKPPFQYWATILGWKIFGLSLFGAFIPSVLALSGVSFVAMKIATILEFERPAVVGLLTAASIGSMTYGSTAQMEIWIVLFLCSAWWSMLLRRYLVAFLLVGMMAWVKGPLYPVLWTTSVILWRLSLLKDVRFVGSLLTGVLVGLSWYVAASFTHYESMLKQFFEVENMGKVTTAQGSIIGLWGEFLYSLFPWTLLLLVAVFQADTRRKWKRHLRFYLAYAGVSAAFFTFFPYRVNTYLYFLTPIMAMLISQMSFDFKQRMKWGVTLFHLVLFSLMAWIMLKLTLQGWFSGWIWIGFSVTALFFVICLKQGKAIGVATASLLMVLMLRCAAVGIGELEYGGLIAFDRQYHKPISYFMDRNDIWHEFGMVSAIIHKPARVITDPQQVMEAIKNGDAVVYQDDQIPMQGPDLQCEEWKRLKRRTKFPFQRLLSEGVAWGDPEITRVFRICFQSS